MKLTFLNHDHGEVVIDRGTLSVGSGAGNDVVLDAEGIADKHARLTQEDGGLFVRALDDADVYVNGRRIRDRAQLRSGDVLGLHRVQARLHMQPRQSAASALESAEEPDRADPTRVRPALSSWYLRGVSGESFGRLLPLRGRMVVGRDEECDITLAAGEVSRRHAAVEVTASGVRVEDLDSSNGTFVNGERIGKKVLEQGDEVSFDTLRFRLETGAGRQSQSAAARDKAPWRRPAVEESSPGGGMVWGVAAVVLVLAVGAAAYFLDLF